MDEKKPTVTMKYVDISSFEFAQAMQKVAQTPVDNRTACAIRRVIKALDKARQEISKEYQEKIAKKFGKRDDKGDLVRPANDQMAFELDESKKDEFTKAQEEFGNTSAILDTRPLTPNDLKDIKLSARDLEVMKELFNDEDEVGFQNQGLPGVTPLRKGPGIPRDI